MPDITVSALVDTFMQTSTAAQMRSVMGALATDGDGSALTGVVASSVALGGVTGLGAGVGAALAINTGSAGAVALQGGAFSGTTATLSFLTSGRVAIVSTAGLLADDGGLLFNPATDLLTVGGNITFGTSASILNGATGSIGLTATGTNQSITLTPSGSGAVLIPSGLVGTPSLAFVGDADNGIYRAGANQWGLVQAGALNLLFNGNVDVTPGGVQNARFVSTHLLLGGLTTDGVGVLQFPAATTSAGGMTFGMDVNWYRTGVGQIAHNSTGTNPQYNFYEGGVRKGFIETSAGVMNLGTVTAAAFNIYTGSGPTLALTLSSTQAATFASTVSATTSLLTPSTTFNLVNATATTVNAFGAATTLNIGASATCILNFGGSTTASEFRFLEPSGSGTNYSAFKAVAQGASITYSLPPSVVAGGALTDVAGNGVLTWVVPSGAGTVGPGTINTIAKFTGSTTVDDSLLTDDGTTLTYSGTGGFSATGSATGIITVTGATSGTLKITGADAMAEDVTISLAAQTVGDATLTIPDMAGTSTTFAFLGKAQTFSATQTFTSPSITTSLVTASTTFALVNATATTVNFAGAATTLNIGSSSTTTILNFGGGATASEFRFLEPSGGGTHYSAFKSVLQSANITYSLPPTVGAAGAALTDAAGNGVLTWVVPAGTGDVVGPGSSTDNGMPRFDGTGGKTLQTSVLTVADTTGTIAGFGTGGGITFHGGTGAITGASDVLTVVGSGIQLPITGIGAAASAGTGLNLAHTALTSVAQLGINSNPVFTSAATTAGVAGQFRLRTEAAAFTMTDGYALRIFAPSIGSGSTVTNNYGLYIQNISGGGTLNYALFTNSGLVRFGDVVSVNAGILPVTNNTGALGSATLQFEDLFLAEGGVINFDNGDATLTQSGNTLTVAGAEFIIDAAIGPTSTVAGGFRGIPQNSQSTAYTTVLADAGKHILHPTADNNARTFTIDSNANVAYPIGTAMTFINQINTVTISITSDTLTFLPAGTTGSRTLAANNQATAIKVAATVWVITGTSGLT